MTDCRPGPIAREKGRLLGGKELGGFPWLPLSCGASCRHYAGPRGGGGYLFRTNARVSILDRKTAAPLDKPEDAFLGATDPRAGRRKGDQAAISLGRAGHLIVQRKRSDCRTAGPVIITLRHLGVQNGKRYGEREGRDDDYAFGHHGSPLGF
jgi:hypothetical protein